MHEATIYMNIYEIISINLFCFRFENTFFVSLSQHRLRWNRIFVIFWLNFHKILSLEGSETFALTSCLYVSAYEM